MTGNASSVSSSSSENDEARRLEDKVVAVVFDNDDSITIGGLGRDCRI